MMSNNANGPDGTAKPSLGASPTRACITQSRVAFLTRNTEALPLRVFEVLFTLSFILWAGHCYLMWRESMTDVLPWARIKGGFLAGLIGLAALGHLLHLGRRPALAALFVSAIYLRGGAGIGESMHVNIYAGIYGLLLITPCARRNEATGRLEVPTLAIRVLQATLILQYVSAGLLKLVQGAWLKFGGLPLAGVQEGSNIAGTLQLIPSGVWRSMQWIWLIFQLEAPLLFCWRKLRPLAFLLGVGYHLLMALVVSGGFYSNAQILTLYALFITADEWRWLGSKLAEARRVLLARLPHRDRPADSDEATAPMVPMVPMVPSMASSISPDETAAGPAKGDQSPLSLTILRHKSSGLPSRRVFLTGAGVTLALPVLESISGGFLSGRKGVDSRPGSKSDHPMRMVCIGNSFGFYPAAFWPKNAGRGYDLPCLLEPLAPHLDHLTLLSGLDHGQKGGHWAINCYLSGVPVADAKWMPDRNISIDQRAAESIGAATRFASLTVGSAIGIAGGCMMSWTRSGTLVPPIPSPKELFHKLFVSDNVRDKIHNEERLALQGSILDAVRGNAKALERQLGKRDVEKLEEYFSSVRDVEKQLELNKRWSNLPKPAPGMPEPEDQGFASDLPVLYDLIALALQTDSTRIATLEIAEGLESAAFRLGKAYHALSHHGQVQETIEELLVLETYQMEQFSRFIGKLKSIQDGDGSLLDHTMVLFGSGMGNANAHTNSNLPIIVSGGGFKHGEFKAYPTTGPNRQPLCNLYVTMLQRFGIEAGKFGTGHGTLTNFS